MLCDPGSGSITNDPHVNRHSAEIVHPCIGSAKRKRMSSDCSFDPFATISRLRANYEPDWSSPAVAEGKRSSTGRDGSFRGSYHGPGCGTAFWFKKRAP